MNKRDRFECALRPALTLAGEEERFALTDRMRHYGVPGLSIAVIDDYRVQWSAAWGVTNSRTGVAMTPDTVLPAASMSKVVAGVVVMGLAEEGALDLDADIREYLRSFRLPDSPHGGTITLRMVMAHKAGLNLHGFGGADLIDRAEWPTLQQILAGEPPSPWPKLDYIGPPGVRTQYSGGGYTLAQIAVEDVTGKPFATHARERIIEPLGLTSSTFVHPLVEPLKTRAADGHDPSGSVVENYWRMHAPEMAGGMWTTPAEYARFLIAVQQDLAGAHRLLGPAASEELITLRTDGDLHGVGPIVHRVRGGHWFEHDGSTYGFKCQFAATCSGGRGAVVMTNSFHGDMLCVEALMTLAELYEWTGFAPPPVVRVDLGEALASYAGRYKITAGMEFDSIHITAAADRLLARIDHLPQTESFPTSAEKFYSSRGLYSSRFELDAHGVPQAVVIYERDTPVGWARRVE